MSQFKGNQASLNQWLNTPEGADFYNSLPDGPNAPLMPRMVPTVRMSQPAFNQARVFRGSINFSRVRPGFTAYFAKLPAGLAMVGKGIGKLGGWLWQVIAKGPGYILKALRFVGRALDKVADVAGEISRVEGGRIANVARSAGRYAKNFATNPITRGRAAVNINRAAVKSFNWVGKGIAQVTVATAEIGGFVVGKLVKGALVTIGKTTFKILDISTKAVGKLVGLTLKTMTRANLGILKGMKGKGYKTVTGQPVRNFFRKVGNKIIDKSLSPTAKAMTAAELSYAVPELLKAFGVNTAALIETGKERLQELTGTEEEED